MATTSDYLTQLQNDKASLVDNLTTKGVTASDDETFTELVPKVLDISSGGDVVIADASYLFYNGARTDNLEAILDVCKNVTNCAYMFYNCRNLTELNISSLDTSNVTTMVNMFNGCANLQSLNISNFNTSNVTSFSSMFNNCSNLTNINLSEFDTSKATNMSNMFASCSSLINLDLSNFNTSNVISMSNMFNRASNLNKIDISGFTSERLSSNVYMFYNTKLTILIIDNPNLFKMTATSMLQNTPIASGTGYVYVPDNMVETYKSATNWSDYSSQIKPISELPSGDE